MKIEQIPIWKIKPAAYNPRLDLKPGDPEFEKLKRSLIEFGFIEPLVWNERSGNLVGGHQRFKVLLHLFKTNQLKGNVTTVDCVVVDYDEKMEKAANVALNKIHGDWDMVKLKDLLVDLDTGDFDLTMTGFDEKELKAMIDWEKSTFTPAGAGSQPSLDEKAKVKCPECGHEFSA